MSIELDFLIKKVKCQLPNHGLKIDIFGKLKNKIKMSARINASV